MKPKDKLPVFPDGLPFIKNADKLPTLNISPDEITITASHVFEEQDVQKDSNIYQIIRWLYFYPEREFFLFLNEGNKANRDIIRKLEICGLLAPKTELNYYRHPNNHPKDYIKLNSEKISFDWEKDVIKKGPKYIRIRLHLSERKKRELEIQEKMEAEQESNKNPLELKPNFMGLGIDILKLFKWIKNKYVEMSNKES